MGYVEVNQEGVEIWRYVLPVCFSNEGLPLILVQRSGESRKLV